jgi:hypothetical protein
MRKLCVASCLSIALTLVWVAPLRAQSAEITASQFYTEYRAAFDKANAVEDIIQYMSTPRRQQIESTPADERAMMFDLMKMLGALSDLKIVKEARAASGATLTVEALDGDKARTTGTITLVKETGAWKIEKEKFSSSSR